MKRSEINQYIREAEAFLATNKFMLPPYAAWTLEQWKEHKAKGDIESIIDCGLGWDVTDFGFEDYMKIGLFLFTIRNGVQHSEKYPKPYAEKIMIVREKQVTPFHYHRFKMEDIINRGGGRLAFRLYNSTPDNKLADTPVTVYRDGVKYVIPAGEVFDIGNGESVTLTQGVYHEFWGVEGTGLVMVGEVSVVNDDHNDNIFLVAQKRFPSIDEDEAPYRLLCSDYDKFLK